LLLIGTDKLSRFDDDYAARRALAGWRKVCERVRWNRFLDVRRQWPKADAAEKCVVFDIRNNRYRIIARIDYSLGVVQILHVLRHKEYDRGSWKNECGC
jgi:mRNA interferase HigB